MQIPKPGEKYKHFKSDSMTYEIIGVAINCDDINQLDVIYKQLYETNDFGVGTIWKRDLENFVGYKEFPSKTKIKRFTKI